MILQLWGEGGRERTVGFYTIFEGLEGVRDWNNNKPTTMTATVDGGLCEGRKDVRDSGYNERMEKDEQSGRWKLRRWWLCVPDVCVEWARGTLYLRRSYLPAGPMCRRRNFIISLHAIAALSAKRCCFFSTTTVHVYNIIPSIYRTRIHGTSKIISALEMEKA